MALIIKNIIWGYKYLTNDLGDERVKYLPLMSSPLPTLIILCLYLRFVLIWGPNMMKNRPAYNLKYLMLGYNFVQIVLNAYVVFESFRCFVFNFNFWCEPVDYSVNPFTAHVNRMTWLYFMLKLSDLLDTVFFVLRKKNSQISFLHIYHHCGMLMLGWVGVKYISGGSSLYIGFINSIVHMVMYAYYFLTVLNPEYKNNIWWKKYITQLQMVQFLFLIILFGQMPLNKSCKYPTWVSFVFVPQNFFMLVLFGDFYYKAYIKTNKQNGNRA